MMTALAGPALLATSAAGVLVAFARSRPADETAPLRAAVARTSVVGGLVVTASVELLSIWSLLTRPTLALVWGAVLVVGWLVAFRLDHNAAWRGGGTPSIRSGERVALCAVMTVFVTVTFVTAVIAPSNNWDAMTYHLPRVAHWLGNHSVRHYPALHVSQLFMPPFPGYAVVTIQGLCATDRWANLVQWLAYVAGAAVASLVVQRMGGAARAQLLAALVFLTIPMAVLQATTAQADLLTAYWMVVLLAFVVEKDSPGNRLWIAGALGLGMLTKPTVALYALPLMVLVAARIVTGAGSLVTRIRRVVVAGATIGVIALGMTVPHSFRCAATFGSPWAGSEVARNANQAIGPRSLLSNLLRESVLHLPLPGYAQLVRYAHGLIGLDTDDPRTTHLYDASYTEVSAKWLRPLAPNENSAGNPLHVLLAAGFLVAALARGKRLDRVARAALLIGATEACGWLLVLTPFKWQPWSARFDLPFFALLAVPLGIGLADLPVRVGRCFAAVLVLGALPALLMAVNRPIVDVVALARPLTRALGARFERLEASGSEPSILTAPSDDVLFRNYPEIRLPYERAARTVQESGCEVVGLEIRRDEWEYPLWRLLRAESGAARPRVHAFGVTNESAHLPPETPEPCAVISTVTPSALTGKGEWSERVISTKPQVAVYLKRPE